ncbi:polysaccharide deacetylase family protein [Arthrobacter sp. PsM3]|uniref:polysaccharide deacetylase family protein n=1 Tax=Arthrobacter sp. PsM3 TaxID=3030531 RepID=UPI00263AE7D0|nr:polysaccharide deacetylase family protein [Arthrobacter sp. PsM3]MDN4643344.1 polysaccharide deacetylase family protein [Arthrobacter sp. PsM3]
MAWTPDRRSFLLAATMALAGCAPYRPETGTAGTGQDASAINAAAGIAAPSPAPAAAPLSSDVVGEPVRVLTRDEVTRTFAGHAATYWGLEAPGVLTRLPSTNAGVALTFDFCGGTSGNGADLALLALLRQQHIPATLFLNSRWITANQALAKDLAGDPLFELGNHGTSHHPLSVTGKCAYGIPGTGNPGEVYDEIMTNNERLTDLTGVRPRYFRAGTAYMDEVSADIVRSLGLIPVGFTINGDAGATFPAATVTREITRARATDIVIAHGNHPAGGTAPGLARALALMKDRGETFLPLPQTSSI